jgi:hypothetical protein
MLREMAETWRRRRHVDWVRAGRGAIERAGGHVASAAKVRAALR